ncbi:ribosomal protein S5 domain 2-type protein [Zopfochytrium polystomum]|nr:ribosomal protein S5 domain 2-type protein [Zopfochytrium polystomum]
MATVRERSRERENQQPHTVEVMASRSSATPTRTAPAAAAANADADAAAASAAAAAAFTLQASTFQKLHPAEYMRRFLAKGLRPDGRTLEAFRKVKISQGSLSSPYGSALVRFGETTALCGIKAEVAVPLPDKPDSGYFVPNVDFPPICSSQFKPGAPSEFTQSVSELIHQITSATNLVDLEALCISPGEAVWVIYADIVFLNYEGNAVDVAMTALVSALNSVKLPKSTYSELDSTVKVEAERTIPLKLNGKPISSTFGIIEDEELLADPTEEEEVVLSGQVTVVFDADSGDMCGVFKPGGAALSKDALDRCMELALAHSENMKSIM